MHALKRSRWLALLPLSLLAAGGQPPDSTVQMMSIVGVTIPARPIQKDPQPEFIAGVGCESPAADFDLQGATFGQRVPVRKSNIMSPEFGGGHGFYLLKTSPAPGPKNDAMLQLVLTGPSKVSTGKPLKLHVEFRNQANQPLVVLRPNDGSLEHMRYPHYDLYLADDANGKVYRYAYKGGRCGNINRTTREDHVSVSTGGQRADVVNGWGSHLENAVIAQRGKFHVWVEYRFCGYESRGIPLGKDVYQPGVWKGAVSSNALAIEVR